ncbi:uncharacterized protein [Rutidosis leptorrhynchoides]|uniref:uncharacterized protein isoform X4 n=1 Tax=Rutidosis leptorrhynchoides TaxID=125765 RepID=UPI003A9A0879
MKWVRHMEDGSVSYIEGAKQPNYIVTADDVDRYLAIEVQPMDNRKRKGELVKVFANEHTKIVCGNSDSVTKRSIRFILPRFSLILQILKSMTVSEKLFKRVMLNTNCLYGRDILTYGRQLH